MQIKLEELKSGFWSKQIAVVGDVVADQFLTGTISRVSREAPVFILKHEETATMPGGAANAAANIASLGGKPILIGVIGNDTNGELLGYALEKRSVNQAKLIVSPTIRTTAKVRVLGGQASTSKRQVIRIDYENEGELSTELTNQISAKLHDVAGTIEAIVFSDYGYGVCCEQTFETARKIASEQRIPLIVDSRFRLNQFIGATSATPNKEEAEALLGREFNTYDAEALRKEFGMASILVTLGNKGMVIAQNGKEPKTIDAVGSDQPVDVTGAGDTVIAAFALGLSSGLSAFDSAQIANHAGSIVVMKPGTSVVTIDELEASLKSDEFETRSATANEN